jgi:hypothetical protein
MSQARSLGASAAAQERVDSTPGASPLRVLMAVGWIVEVSQTVRVCLAVSVRIDCALAETAAVW